MRAQSGRSAWFAANVVLGALVMALVTAACTAARTDGSTSAGSSASTAAASSPAAAEGGPVEWITTLPVDGVDHAVQVRGSDRRAPVLLVIHGGPGFAMIDLLHETMPELEDTFVTVNYDQRGAGLSYSPDVAPDTITLDQLAEDADAIRVAVLDHLGAEPGREVFVMGHSMGTMIAMHLLGEHPGDYAGYVGVGQVVDVVANEQGSYDFALTEARADADTAAIGQLECVGRPLADFSYPGCPTDPDLDGFEVTACWTAWYGGDVWGATDDDAVVAAILDSPAYRGHRDQWWEGLELSQALFDDPAVLTWDAADAARDLSVPVYVLQGHHDQDTPWPLAEALMPELDGARRLVWFEDSSHFPFFEEPGAFRETLVAMTDGRLPADGSVSSAGAPGPEPDRVERGQPCR